MYFISTSGAVHGLTTSDPCLKIWWLAESLNITKSNRVYKNMSNSQKNKGRKKRTGRRNSKMNYDQTTNTQVKFTSRSNKTNKRCCKNSFSEDLMNLRMFGEWQKYCKGRNLKALRGSIISRLPDHFVAKYNRHMDHFVKYLENEIKK